MTVKIFDATEVQDFLKTVSGFDQAGGSERAKQILHRLLSDVYRMIDDFDVTPEEFWGAISQLNALGKETQFGLLAPGLGFDHYLDMRMDAADERAGLAGGTHHRGPALSAPRRPRASRAWTMAVTPKPR